MTSDITPEAIEHLCAIHEGYEQHGTVATLRALSAALTASQAETAAAVKPLMWGGQGDPMIATQEDMVEYLILDDGLWWSWRDNLGSMSSGYGSKELSMRSAEEFDKTRILTTISTPADSKAALDRMNAEAEERGMRKAVGILEATYEARRNAGLPNGFNAMMSAKEAILAAIPKGTPHE